MLPPQLEREGLEAALDPLDARRQLGVPRVERQRGLVAAKGHLPVARGQLLVAEALELVRALSLLRDHLLRLDLRVVRVQRQGAQ